MVRKSVIARNSKRLVIIRKFSDKKKKVKASLLKLLKPNVSPMGRLDARDLFRQLTEFPRDASTVRYKFRCNISNRPKAYNRFTGLSRIKFRELASQGMLPGIRKSSF